MGEKAVQKREYIIKQAERIFVQKGFKHVTMKDIVAACNISRGGVYLYFNDTKEIFEAVLQLHAHNRQDLFAGGPDNDSSARAAMSHFLNEQKKELLDPAESLIIATYEYLFTQSGVPGRPEPENSFQSAAGKLEALIQLGVNQGEFFVDPQVAAQNIVLLLEGLRISSTVLSFDRAFLDRQMKYVLSQLEGGQNEAKTV